MFTLENKTRNPYSIKDRRGKICVVNPKDSLVVDLPSSTAAAIARTMARGGQLLISGGSPFDQCIIENCFDKDRDAKAALLDDVHVDRDETDVCVVSNEVHEQDDADQDDDSPSEPVEQVRHPTSPKRDTGGSVRHPTSPKPGGRVRIRAKR